MKFNGNITLNALGQSEVQNLVVERFASTPAFSASEAGRLIYNTTARLYYMNSGLGWVALATGGDASALQSEVDALETSLGAVVTSTGAFNPAALSGNNLVNVTSLTDAINKLDAAISGKDALQELVDVAVGSASAGQFLRYDSVAGKWVNHTLVTADITDLTVSASELNFVKGVTSGVQAQITGEVTRATQAEANIQANVLAETTRATAAEGALQTSLDSTSGALATEVTRATAAETALGGRIDTEITDRTAADAVVAANASDLVSTETSQRSASDVTINARIDGVQAELDATQAGAGLGVAGAYTAPAASTYLTSATSLADATAKLDAALKAEADARASLTSTSDAALAAEVQARVDGDANLQAQLTAYIDGAVTNNVNADNAETAARIAADSALQAELDATQVGAGLGTNGAYTADATTNFIGSAVSLANADKLLDAKIKVVADSLAAEITSNDAADTQLRTDLTTEIQARIDGDVALGLEVNAIEAGAGLEGDGTYVAPTGSNFLGAAVSLKDADFILDSAIKSEETRAKAAEVVNATAISAETTRAEAAEAALQAGIDAEATRATAAEGANTTAINAEVTRATGIEGGLRTDLTAEVSRATAAEAAITAKLSKGYHLYDGAAASSHTVAHGIGSQFCNVTVIDSATNEQIIPQSVVFDSASQLTVTFNVALACKVVVMGLGV